MSVSSSGRRPIENTVPLLQGRTCVISIGLRKEWADSPTYWIELYAKPLGPHKKSHLLTMARQWSFFRKATRERIEDQYVMPNQWTSVNNAVDSILDYIKTRVAEKEEVVHCVSCADRWEDVATSIRIKLRAKSSLPGPAGSDKLPPKEKTVAEKFKESVAERSKKANW